MAAGQVPEEFRELLSAVVDGQPGARGLRRLEEILLASPELQSLYNDFMTLHSMLLWEAGPPLSSSQSPSPVIVVDSSAPVRSPLLASNLSGIGSWMFSYMVATLLVGIGLLAGWAYRINGLPTMPATTTSKPEIAPVGRITGMADCQWTDPRFQVLAGDSVRLGQEYDLSAGYLEIAYDRGAKVILQGPCKYVVDSETGGFLGIGELTARIESRASKVESPAESARQEPRSRPSTRDAGLFTVRTPTATITDLGTEFGVSVDELGSKVHVFSGQVDVGLHARSGAAGGSRHLTAGQMASVGRAGIQTITHSGLRPMAVVRERFFYPGFAYDFRLQGENPAQRGQAPSTNPLHQPSGERLVLRGDAQIVGDAAEGKTRRLRLTDNREGCCGSAWHSVRQPVAGGFSAEFAFEFSEPRNFGADGMAFVVQDTAEGHRLLVGEKGAADHALSVCFDSYQNREEGDPSNAWIAVRAGGKIVGHVDLWTTYGLMHLSGSGMHTARVDYRPGRLDVYLDGQLVLANVAVDLRELAGGPALGADGKAWIGFGARTGSASENHDVSMWRFSPPRPSAAIDFGKKATPDGTQREHR
jgi:hypothetical protein